MELLACRTDNLTKAQDCENQAAWRSRQITNVYDCVCVENLKMKGMSQALNFGKSVADNAFGSFVTMLTYKLSEQGKQLIKINKWFPSSKTCSKCGELGLSELSIVAKNVVQFSTVINNIRNECMRLLSA